MKRIAILITALVVAVFAVSAHASWYSPEGYRVNGPPAAETVSFVVALCNAEMHLFISVDDVEDVEDLFDAEVDCELCEGEGCSVECTEITLGDALLLDVFGEDDVLTYASMVRLIGDELETEAQEAVTINGPISGQYVAMSTNHMSQTEKDGLEAWAGSGRYDAGAGEWKAVTEDRPRVSH